MILPVLTEKLALPLFDWSLAVMEALGHVAQGTLTHFPAPGRASDSK